MFKFFFSSKKKPNLTLENTNEGIAGSGNVLLYSNNLLSEKDKIFFKELREKRAQELPQKQELIL